MSIDVWTKPLLNMMTCRSPLSACLLHLLDCSSRCNESRERWRSKRMSSLNLQVFLRLPMFPSFHSKWLYKIWSEAMRGWIISDHKILSNLVDWHENIFWLYCIWVNFWKVFQTRHSSFQQQLLLFVCKRSVTWHLTHHAVLALESGDPLETWVRRSAVWKGDRRYWDVGKLSLSFSAYPCLATWTARSDWWNRPRL